MGVLNLPLAGRVANNEWNFYRPELMLRAAIRFRLKHALVEITFA